MKQKLLSGILCLGMLTLYFACQKDDTVVKEEQNEVQEELIITTLSYHEVDATF